MQFTPARMRYMPDLLRLIQFIEAAPRGTMVPVESLRELIPTDADAMVETKNGLSPAELRTSCIQTRREKAYTRAVAEGDANRIPRSGGAVVRIRAGA